MCVNVREVWSSLDVWLLKADLYRRNNREQRLFSTYLFPKPALHLILVFHLDPIVALPGESSALTSNIRKRIGQSKMRKCSCHFISCHVFLKTMNTFLGALGHHLTCNSFYLSWTWTGNMERVLHLVNRCPISIEMRTM